MINTRYGKLVVLAEAEPSGSHKRWLCVCDCGCPVVVWQMSLRRGTTRSCGCAVNEFRAAAAAGRRVGSFWSKVRRGDESECWPWIAASKQGPKNNQPYGIVGWEGRTESSHRVAYRIAHGEIPAGAMVLHICDFGLCCNPAHLYLGDHAQNMRDMVERRRRSGRAAGEGNGRSKLTLAQVAEIRTRYAAGGVSQQALGDEFGVSQFAVSQIVRGKRYALP
jgi:hypothetical protein